MSRACNLWKTFDGDCNTTNISQFISKNDTVFAFQLDLDAPVYKRSYNTYSNYGTSTGVKREMEIDAVEESPHFVIDLCIGWIVKSEYTSIYNNNRLELQAPPNKLSFNKKCSCREVHEKVFSVLRRIIHHDSPFKEVTNIADVPYDLVVTNSFATVKKAVVENNDEEFVHPGAEMMLCVVLKSTSANAAASEHFDVDELRGYKNLEEMNSNGNNNNGSDNNKPKLNIYHCLDKFNEREQLQEAETIYCSKCKQHLAPIKKMDIWSAPDVLILHLKRFLIVPGQFVAHQREKISDFVDFPIENLDLTKYVIGNNNTNNNDENDNNALPIYDLYAVSHHMGGLGGGHYTATCKNFINNKWFFFLLFYFTCLILLLADL
jgi:hypothetical protein